MSIYKMLLQPLIENSILHGFSDITEEGHILIQIQALNDKLSITILDNGKEISPEQLTALRKLIANPTSEWNDNIGLFNVLGRLHAYYQKDYQFEIEVQQGTKVHILIPNQPYDVAF